MLNAGGVKSLLLTNLSPTFRGAGLEYTPTGTSLW